MIDCGNLTGRFGFSHTQLLCAFFDRHRRDKEELAVLIILRHHLRGDAGERREENFGRRGANRHCSTARQR